MCGSSRSSAVDAPVAFGVRDKVIAPPLRFLISGTLAERELAIEHELAHHRGRDLLANILAQGVLALHWFNPLAWAAWSAMRRDQEAACDARAMAGRDLPTRAAYARVIAGFASSQRLFVSRRAGRADGLPGAGRQIDNPPFEEPDHERYLPRAAAAPPAGCWGRGPRSRCR